MSWRILLLVCVSFAVYAINLDDYFLADDFDLIGSFYGKPASYFLQLLYGNEFGDAWTDISYAQTEYIRPVKIWLLKLDYTIWGTNAAGYHFTATVFFALTVVMVFLIADLLLPGRRNLALLAGLMTAIHPVFSEIVPSITFREETITSAAGLSSLYFFLRHRLLGRSSFGFYILYATAILSKESGIAIAGLAAGYDLSQTIGVTDFSAQIRRRARLYFPVLGIVAAYFALRVIAFGTGLGVSDSHYLSLQALGQFHSTFFGSLFHESMFALPWRIPIQASFWIGLALALTLIGFQRAKLGERYLRTLLFVGPVWYLAASSVLYGTYFDPRHNVIPVVGVLLFAVTLLDGALRGADFRWERSAVATIAAVAGFAFLPPTLELSHEYDRASRTVARVRARIEAETAHLPPGSKIHLINVPQGTTPPYYFGWGLLSALKQPFTETDLATKSLVVNVRNIQLNAYDVEIPEEYDYVLRLCETWPKTRPWVWPNLP